MHPSTLPTRRPSRRSRLTPVEAGLPDPRPLTEYTAVYEESEGNSLVYVTLEQPCIIRAPMWGFVDAHSGLVTWPVEAKPLSNTVIRFTFDGLLDKGVSFIDVPWQDTQVQNFQGGFVRPGGKWFRPAA